MRKISLVTATALTLAGTIGFSVSAPMTAWAASCQPSQIKVLVGNSNNNCNTQETKDKLAKYGINLDELLKNSNSGSNCYVVEKNNCNTGNNTESNKNCETDNSCNTDNSSGNKTPDNPVTPEPPAETPSAGETPSTEESAKLSYAEQVVKLVNEERAKAGLSALTLDTSVQAAAQVRAKESATSFSHTRPDGTGFSTALTDQGVKYKGSGENIAWGQKTPEEVMKGWMNSPGHKANIMNSKYTKIGVGYYQNAKGINYWSQLFIY